MKKKAILLSIVAAMTFVTYSFISNATDEIALNSTLPNGDLKMKSTADKEVKLDDIKTAKGLLVIFSCNTCPYVKLSESRIKENVALATKLGIGVAIVNSNAAQRDGDDSMEEMKKYAKIQAYTAPYLLDDNSVLADAFGATRTPQCFLFDKDGKLSYKGAIDDNVKDVKAVKASYLKDALTAVGAGNKPSLQETKSIGCTIKRNE